jgi:hypothetical protein
MSEKQLAPKKIRLTKTLLIDIHNAKSAAMNQEQREATKKADEVGRWPTNDWVKLEELTDEGRALFKRYHHLSAQIRELVEQRDAVAKEAALDRLDFSKS